MVRKIYLTSECIEFLESLDSRGKKKFLQIMEVLLEIPIVHTHFLKKLTNTRLYELRIRSGLEYRLILKSLDHDDFNQCTKAVCIHGFMKKATKEYRKEISRANRILMEWQRQHES